MPTTVSGTDGVDNIKAATVTQADMATGVAGTGPAFRAYATGTTSCTPTLNKIALAAETFDPATAFDTTTSRFQPLVAGYYQLNGCAQFASSLYAVRVAIYKNGALHSYGAVATTGTSAGISDLVYLNGSTDYVELFGYSSTTQNAVASGDQTYFSGSLARAA